MNTIVDLIEQYPNLEYEDGYFYEDTDSEGYLVDDDMKPLDAHSYIEEFFHGESITLPNSGDPREDREQVMTGKEYISYMFNDDYNSAFRYIHPKNVVKLPKGEVDKEEPFQSWTEQQLNKSARIWHEQIDRTGYPIDSRTMKQPPFGVSALQYASIIEELKVIQTRYPDILKDFIDNHYGKTN